MALIGDVLSTGNAITQSLGGAQLPKSVRGAVGYFDTTALERTLTGV